MRKLRESFEFLAGLGNMQNDLINRGKTPHGFQLLDQKDSERGTSRAMIESKMKKDFFSYKKFLGMK